MANLRVKTHSRMKGTNSQLSLIKYDSSSKLFIVGGLGREERVAGMSIFHFLLCTFLIN